MAQRTQSNHKSGQGHNPHQNHESETQPCEHGKAEPYAQIKTGGVSASSFTYSEDAEFKGRLTDDINSWTDWTGRGRLDILHTRRVLLEQPMLLFSLARASEVQNSISSKRLVPCIALLARFGGQPGAQLSQTIHVQICA